MAKMVVMAATGALAAMIVATKTVWSRSPQNQSAASISAGETVWARGYLICRNEAGEIFTLYSPISSYTL